MSWSSRSITTFVSSTRGRVGLIPIHKKSPRPGWGRRAARRSPAPLGLAAPCKKVGCEREPQTDALSDVRGCGPCANFPRRRRQCQRAARPVSERGSLDDDQWAPGALENVHIGSSPDRETEGSLTFVIVCQCKVVSDADLRRAVEAGARSLGSACRATGASSDCGHCVFQVKAVVGELVDAYTSYTPKTLAQLAEVLHEAEEPARRRTA